MESLDIRATANGRFLELTVCRFSPSDAIKVLEQFPYCCDPANDREVWFFLINNPVRLCRSLYPSRENAIKQNQSGSTQRVKCPTAFFLKKNANSPNSTGHTYSDFALNSILGNPRRWIVVVQTQKTQLRRSNVLGLHIGARNTRQ